MYHGMGEGYAPSFSSNGPPQQVQPIRNIPSSAPPQTPPQQDLKMQQQQQTMHSYMGSQPRQPQTNPYARGVTTPTATTTTRPTRQPHSIPTSNFLPQPQLLMPYSQIPTFQNTRQNSTPIYNPNSVYQQSSYAPYPFFAHTFPPHILRPGGLVSQPGGPGSGLVSGPSGTTPTSHLHASHTPGQPGSGGGGGGGGGNQPGGSNSSGMGQPTITQPVTGQRKRGQNAIPIIDPETRTAIIIDDNSTPRQSSRPQIIELSEQDYEHPNISMPDYYRNMELISGSATNVGGNNNNNSSSSIGGGGGGGGGGGSSGSGGGVIGVNIATGASNNGVPSVANYEYIRRSTINQQQPSTMAEMLSSSSSPSTTPVVSAMSDGPSVDITPKPAKGKRLNKPTTALEQLASAGISIEKPPLQVDKSKMKQQQQHQQLSQQQQNIADISTSTINNNANNNANTNIKSEHEKLSAWHSNNNNNTTTNSSNSICNNPKTALRDDIIRKQIDELNSGEYLLHHQSSTTPGVTDSKRNIVGLHGPDATSSGFLSKKDIIQSSVLQTSAAEFQPANHISAAAAAAVAATAPAIAPTQVELITVPIATATLQAVVPIAAATVITSGSIESSAAVKPQAPYAAVIGAGKINSSSAVGSSNSSSSSTSATQQEHSISFIPQIGVDGAVIATGTPGTQQQHYHHQQQQQQQHHHHHHHHHQQQQQQQQQQHHHHHHHQPQHYHHPKSVVAIQQQQQQTKQHQTQSTQKIIDSSSSNQSQQQRGSSNKSNKMRDRITTTQRQQQQQQQHHQRDTTINKAANASLVIATTAGNEQHLMTAAANATAAAPRPTLSATESLVTPFVTTAANNSSKFNKIDGSTSRPTGVVSSSQFNSSQDKDDVNSNRSSSSASATGNIASDLKMSKKNNSNNKSSIAYIASVPAAITPHKDEKNAEKSITMTTATTTLSTATVSTVPSSDETDKSASILDSNLTNNNSIELNSTKPLLHNNFFGILVPDITNDEHRQQQQEYVNMTSYTKSSLLPRDGDGSSRINDTKTNTNQLDTMPIVSVATGVVNRESTDRDDASTLQTRVNNNNSNKLVETLAANNKKNNNISTSIIDGTINNHSIDKDLENNLVTEMNTMQLSSSGVGIVASSKSDESADNTKAETKVETPLLTTTLTTPTTTTEPTTMTDNDQKINNHLTATNNNNYNKMATVATTIVDEAVPIPMEQSETTETVESTVATMNLTLLTPTATVTVTSEINLPLNYEDGQWSPLNTEGRKYWNHEQLMMLREQPASQEEPKYIDSIGPIARVSLMPKFASQSMYNKQHPATTQRGSSNAYGKRPSQNAGQQQQMGSGNSNSIGGIGGGSSSIGSSGGGGKGSKSGMIQISLSLREDVKLNESANAWKPSFNVKPNNNIDSSQSNEAKSDEELTKRVRGVLNKLTPEKFDTLLEQIKSLKIDTIDRLQKVILLVFEKAIDEPNFSVAYAQLCNKLSIKCAPAAAMAQGEQSNTTAGTGEMAEQQALFRKNLILKCQNEFQSYVLDETNNEMKLKKLQETIDKCTDPDKKAELTANLEDEDRKIRRRSVGTVRFIGELYKIEMLNAKIMSSCINQLLEKSSEDKLECLCKLLTTVGHKLENEDKRDLNAHFKTMQLIVDKKHMTQSKISSRVRFMLQDVIDLRKDKWISRHDDSNPKTMGQILKEAEAEQINNHILNYNLAGRKDDSRSGGGNLGSSGSGSGIGIGIGIGGSNNSGNSNRFDMRMGGGNFNQKSNRSGSGVGVSGGGGGGGSSISIGSSSSGSGGVGAGSGVGVGVGSGSGSGSGGGSGGGGSGTGAGSNSGNINNNSGLMVEDGWSIKNSKSRSNNYSVDTSKFKPTANIDDNTTLGAPAHFKVWNKNNQNDGSHSSNSSLSMSSVNPYSALDRDTSDVGRSGNRSKEPYHSKGSMERDRYGDRSSRSGSQHNSRENSVARGSYASRIMLSSRMTSQSMHAMGSQQMRDHRDQSGSAGVATATPTTVAAAAAAVTTSITGTTSLISMSTKFTHQQQEQQHQQQQQQQQQQQSLNDTEISNNDKKQIITLVKGLLNTHHIGELETNTIREELEKVPERYRWNAILKIFECAVETGRLTSDDRAFAGIICADWLKYHLITSDQLLFGLQKFFTICDDLVIDIPMIWIYISEILTPLFKRKCLTIKNLLSVCTILCEKKLTEHLLENLLPYMLVELDPQFVLDLWTGHTFNEFNIANVKEFIEKNHFEYLVDPLAKPMATHVNIEKVQTRIAELLRDGTINDSIVQYISATVREIDKSFIRALTTVLVEHSIESKTYKLNVELFKSRLILLQRYVDNKEKREVECLYAIQILINKLEHPSGLLRMVLEILCNEDIISIDGFKKWRDSSEEQEGKGVAIKSVYSFFIMLEEQQQDDSSCDGDN